MDEQQSKKKMLENFSTTQTFVIGIVAGFLVLCAIGFFVMVAIYFKGGSTNVGGSNNNGETGEKGPAQFSQCLDSGKYATKVNADVALGSSLGVNGTPATFVNGYLIGGAYPYAAVKDVIEDALAGRKVFLDDYKSYGLETGELPKVDMPNLPDVVWKGDEKSTVTVVEFSDFECPYCVRFFPTMEQVLATYGDKIRFTYRHFPLTSIHKSAQKAAEAYECAKEQGKWFEMYTKLFTLSEQQQLNIDNYKTAATDLGLK